jgi:hypothetical protein
MTGTCIERAHRIARSALVAVAAVSAAFFHPPAAQAGNLFDGHDTCTTLNCGSLLIEGKVLTYRANNGAGAPTHRLPWSAMVYADANECLRLDVVDESADLAMTAVTPNGYHLYRSDDPSSGSCPLCPILKIDPVPYGGWYSVSISTVVTTADASFKLRIGRYNGGNPNCASPTPPQ